MFFGWEINGLAAFIIIIAYIWIKDRRKAKNSDVCEKRHDETRGETDETTDLIDKDGYEWWNDPRWRE